MSSKYVRVAGNWKENNWSKIKECWGWNESTEGRHLPCTWLTRVQFLALHVLKDTRNDAWALLGAAQIKIKKLKNATWKNTKAKENKEMLEKAKKRAQKGV